MYSKTVPASGEVRPREPAAAASPNPAPRKRAAAAAAAAIGGGLVGAVAGTACGWYRCVKKSQLRAAAEMESEKAGVLEAGDHLVEVTEVRRLESGAVRCRLVAPAGWVSLAAGRCALAGRSFFIREFP
jgi:hypothetical protein